MEGRFLPISKYFKSTILSFFDKLCYRRNILREECYADKITAWYASNKQELHIYKFFCFVTVLTIRKW